MADRKSILLIEQADRLREASRIVKLRHPFDGCAAGPSSAIWRLPPGGADYPTRWALIKAGFSRGIPKGERIRPSRSAKREPGIWQRRYWAHLIRDGQDLQTHVDYIHHNPVKHGYVAQASWPHSSIRCGIRIGWMKVDWVSGSSWVGRRASEAGDIRLVSPCRAQ